MIQKVPEQRTWEAQRQGARENSHIKHCTHTHIGHANIRLQGVYRGKS